MIKSRALVAALVAFALVASACGDDEEGEAPATADASEAAAEAAPDSEAAEAPAEP